MATSINLAPGTQYIVEARKRRRRLFAISITIVVVLLLSWIALLLYRSQLTNQEENIEAQIRGIDSEIAKLDADAQRIILFENRLKDLDLLLVGHISWDAVFTDIEKFMPGNTRLTNISLDSDRAVLTIGGITPDADSVAVALASLTNDPTHKTIFSSAKLVGVTREEVRGDAGQVGSVSYKFSADLTFDPGILKNQ